MKHNQNLFKPSQVKELFDRCSDRYIRLSYLFSFGFTERWRRRCVTELPEPETCSPIFYDLMAGTGEAWSHVLLCYPQTLQISAIDISSGMYDKAMVRLHLDKIERVSYICDNVLDTGLDAQSADAIVCTFGLKTFNVEQQRQLAALVKRVLKPSGVFSFVEASDPKGWILRSVYNFYMRKTLPLVERFLMKGAQDFSMIGTYTRLFVDATAFANALKAEGLQVEFKSYFFGCATGVVGRKPH